MTRAVALLLNSLILPPTGLQVFAAPLSKRCQQASPPSPLALGVRRDAISVTPCSNSISSSVLPISGESAGTFN